MNNPESQFLSPMRSTTSQPLKKQRGGSTPVIDRQSETPGTSDAIARRRAELRRLQAQRDARNQKMAEPSPSAAPPKLPPPGQTVARHHSDLFPAVPKSPSSTKQAVPPLAKPLPKLANSPVREQGRSSPAPAQSRAKSAPPSRPPPPPPRLPPSGNARTPSGGRGSHVAMVKQSHEAPPMLSSSSSRTRTVSKDMPPPRPAPMAPGTLTVSKKEDQIDPPPPPAGGALPSIPVIQAESEKPPELLPEPKMEVEAAAPEPTKVDAPPKAETKADTKTLNVVAPTGPPPITTAAAPPLVEETPVKTATPPAQTPMPVATPNVPPPSSRRDRLQTMREAATPMVSETAKRLEEQLKQSQKERKVALETIKKLEDELTKERSKPLPVTPTKTTENPKALQTVLQMAQDQGEKAALQWARAQVQGLPPLSNSSMAGASPLLARQRTMGHRPRSLEQAPVPTLLPNNPNPVEVERRFIQHFQEAGKIVAQEFQSPLATYVVRRPYGLAQMEEELFQACQATPPDTYHRKSHVSAPASLEVACILNIPSRPLALLSGEHTLKYQQDGEWKSLESEETTSLITYIDDEGVERDLRLDQLLEEALQVRWIFARMLTATALGFQARPPKIVKEAADSVPELPKAETQDSAVDTSDLPGPPPVIETHSKKEETPKQETPATKHTPPPEPAQTTDVAASILGGLLKSIVGFIWWVLIGMPLAIVRTTVVSGVAIVILSMAYLQLKEENGFSLSSIGSPGGGFHQNRPGSGIL